MHQVAERKTKPASSAKHVLAENRPASRVEGRVQAWRAWSGCGDGVQVDLIIDSPAHQAWLMAAGEIDHMPRSLE